LSVFFLKLTTALQTLYHIPLVSKRGEQGLSALRPDSMNNWGLYAKRRLARQRVDRRRTVVCVQPVRTTDIHRHRCRDGARPVSTCAGYLHYPVIGQCCENSIL